MFNFYEYIRRKWSEYSESSGQKGTVIDELAVKPSGLIMADFYNLLVDQRTTNDISNWKNMTREQLAFFGNKFFQPIIDGNFAFGKVRIWFDERKDVEISEDARFVSNSGLQYKAIQPGFTSRNSFVYSNERFALYYISIPIIAASAGDEYNVDAGEISQLNNVNFTYKSISNQDNVDNGSKTETAEEYYQRLRYTVNDGSLMNKRSIFARLPEFFPIVRSIYISAPGDKYMKRDLVSGIDLSQQSQKSDYLGKITGENMVKSLAFYGIYPPDVESSQREFFGPYSIPSEYRYPLTIDPTDLDSTEPGFRGYQVDQEFDQDMYKGVYFDEYKTVMEKATVDLFNITDEDVGIEDVVTPSSDWVYGANGLRKGNFGSLFDEVDERELIKFNSNTITLSSGAKSSISTGIDIKKRTGIKVAGRITFPEVSEEDVAPSNSDFQVMVAGRNGVNVDAYTGIGFGVRIVSPFIAEEDAEEIPLPTNAIVYFAHSLKSDITIFASADDDFVNTSGVTSLGALAETNWRIEPNVEYEFEFVVHDDLKLTLHLNKLDNRLLIDDDESENELHYELPKSVLGVYESEINKPEAINTYGTTLKLSLKTEVEDSSAAWLVNDLRAFDIQRSRATALFAVNVRNMEDPISVYLRAFGFGSVNDVFSEGYSAYIWDKETTTIATEEGDLTNGGWKKLDGISNETGTKDVLSTLLRHEISNFERYKTQSRFGENIFIMLVASGSSKMNSTYSGSFEDDIHSRIQVDYIKVESEVQNYYHANNKSDLYMVTVQNNEVLETATTTITKSTGDSFFELNEDNGFKMPIQDIVSVNIGEVSEVNDSLSDTEYTVVRPDPLFDRSSKETVQIVLNDFDADTITVEYTTYPSIADVQEFFDGKDYGKTFGDVLAKHKYPIGLSFNVSFTGNIGEEELVEEIKKYVDDNIDGVFSTRTMVSYLYNEELVNNVREPITISYTRYNDDGEIETGTFTDTLEARDIDFFRIVDLSVTRL